MKTITTLAVSALLFAGQASAGSGAILYAVYCAIPGVSGADSPLLGATGHPALIATSHYSYGSVSQAHRPDFSKVVAVQPGIGHNVDALDDLLSDSGSVY